MPRILSEELLRRVMRRGNDNGSLTRTSFAWISFYPEDSVSPVFRHARDMHVVSEDCCTKITPVAQRVLRADGELTASLFASRALAVKNRPRIHRIVPERHSLDTERQTDGCDAVLMRIALV